MFDLPFSVFEGGEFSRSKALVSDAFPMYDIYAFPMMPFLCMTIIFSNRF